MKAENKKVSYSCMTKSINAEAFTEAIILNY